MGADLTCSCEESVPDDHKYHETKRNDVCVAPQDDLVTGEALHLLEVLEEEVEATEEEDKLEQDVVE